MKGRKLISLLSLTAAFMMAPSCEKMIELDRENGKIKAKKCLIIYSAGHNNLSASLISDIRELTANAPSGYTRSYQRIIVFSHKTAGTGYNVPVDPVLMEAYKDNTGAVVLDTLVRFQSKEYDPVTYLPSVEGYTGSDVKTLKTVLEYIKDNFPSEEYGFLFSSHGTGWLPYDYYRKGVITKSIGADYSGPNYNSAGIPCEMELTDFAQTFRDTGMKMSHMLMDACFMGCIEAAYEMRDICDYYMASPTEIYSNGYPYGTLLKYLWGSPEPDLASLGEAFMAKYRGREATISVTRTAGLENLARVCADIFGRYTAQISAVDESQVQAFFRREQDHDYEKHWFYDLGDILTKAGVSAEDLESFNAALNACIIYKSHTVRLFDGRECKAYCGFSSYLPCAGNMDLDNYYTRFMWNKATRLVK